MVFRSLLVGSLVCCTGLPPTNIGAVEPHLNNWESPSVSRLHDLEESPIAVPSIVDVELNAIGVLQGELRDQQGSPVSAILVSLTHQGKIVQQVSTDSQGRFQFPLESGGRFEVHGPSSVTFCRVWRAGTAPPRARSGLLMIRDGSTERGQQPITTAYPYNPFLMGAMVAATVAIPIAVHDGGHDLPDGS